MPGNYPEESVQPTRITTLSKIRTTYKYLNMNLSFFVHGRYNLFWKIIKLQHYKQLSRLEQFFALTGIISHKNFISVLPRVPKIHYFQNYSLIRKLFTESFLFLCTNQVFVYCIQQSIPPSKIPVSLLIYLLISDSCHII